MMSRGTWPRQFQDSSWWRWGHVAASEGSAAALAAVVVLLVPHFATAPIFNAPIFYPLGLQTIRPFTFDYEPIFPWFSVTLLGVAFAKSWPAVLTPDTEAELQHVGGPVRLLAAAGRNSLVVYLLHQPIRKGLDEVEFLALREP